MLESWGPSPEGLTTLLAQAELEALHQHELLRAARTAYSAMLAERDGSRLPEPVTRLSTMESIGSRLAELAMTADSECLSIHPGRARGPASAPLQHAALHRGVLIRAVYQDSIRNDPGALSYARWLSRIGAQLRTVPAITVSLVVIDRRIAVILDNPSDAGCGAVEVTSPGLVAMAVDHFDQAWSAARPLTAQVADESELSPQQRALLGFLAAGLTDDMAARRLDVSLRTVRRMSADLMARLGARSRFQAGVIAAGKGWIPLDRAQDSAPGLTVCDQAL